VAVLEREIPKAWESKKGSSGQPLKSKLKIKLHFLFKLPSASCVQDARVPLL
jgi:hypothetical protein